MNVENTNKPQEVTHNKRSEANSKQIRSAKAGKPLADYSKASYKLSTSVVNQSESRQYFFIFEIQVALPKRRFAYALLLYSFAFRSSSLQFTLIPSV